MNCCICTSKIRSKACSEPPFGSMLIIQSLRKIGQEVHFYNIDYHRPNHKQIVKYFTENNFDIIGISAVVSTSYSFVKYLSNLIRQVSPKSVVIVGGNLAASAEILLRTCKVDFCVIGEGYYIIQDLVKVFEKRAWNYEQLKAITGICFLDQNNQFHFTGYRESIPTDSLDLPDYSILEADESFHYYISDSHYPYARYGFKPPENMDGKRCAYVPVGQGCPNRCTFCHRWIKGYRMRPLDQIEKYIQNIKDRYNVGFIEIFDESFGTVRKTTHDLVTKLGEMGMFWITRGARADSVTRETLMHWKKNGCCMVTYGNESFSPTILNVMEKRVTVEQNLDALKWSYEAGIPTIVQLVLAMPGETDRTIQETIDNMKKSFFDYYPDAFRGRSKVMGISINYAMALPGTPLYEYARQHGYIARNLDEEEKYLIKISDVEAEDFKHLINYTKLPLLKVLMWRYKIIYELNINYVENGFGVDANFSKVLRILLNKMFIDWNFFKKIWYKDHESKIRCINKKALRLGIIEKPIKYFKSIIIFNHIVKPLFYLFLPYIVAIKTANSIPEFFSLITEYLRWKLVHMFLPVVADLPKKSLREIVDIKLPGTPEQGSIEMIPLRRGR